MKKEKLYQNKKLMFFILYTAVCVLLLLYYNVIFSNSNKGYGWIIDSLPVQMPMFTYLRNYTRRILHAIFINHTFSIPFFDFNIGMGGDSLTYLSMWYLEPISFLSTFFNNNSIECLYDILTLVRIYLVGLSFGIVCFYYKKDNPIIVTIGSLLYTFTGWTFFFIRHPVFFATLIYFPLLVIGIEEIFRGKRGLFFTLMIFISAWTHYYFLYINTIFLIIFFIVENVEYLHEHNMKKFLSNFFSVCWRYVLGIGLSMFVFLPNIITFLNSNRTSPIIETGSLFKFEKGWFSSLFIYLIAPFKTPGHWLNNGFIPLGIICVLICFSLKKKFTNIKIYTIICMIMFTLPIFTFILHGFSSIHFRWNYIVGFIFSICVVFILHNINEISYKNYIYIPIILFLYVGALFINKELINQYSICGFFYLITYICILLYLGNKSKNLLYFSLLIVICANICSNINFTYEPKYGNYISEFVDKGKSIDLITNTSAKATTTINDTEFYRTDSAKTSVSNENSAIFLLNKGISCYVNVMDKHLVDYYHGLENVNTRLLDTLNNDNRTVLEELSSVKYFTIYEGEESYVPYGYTYYSDVYDENNRLMKVYINKYYLPIAYTYSSYMIEDTYNNLSSVEKQDALMQAVILKDDTTNISKLDFKTTVSQCDNITITGYDCSYDANTKKVTVTKGGGYLNFCFDNKKNCETYLRLQNLNIDNFYNAYWTLRVYNDTVDKNFEIRSNSATYSYGCYDYMINLGYSEKGITSVNLAFPFVGEFSLDDIQILYYPMKSYKKNAMKLSENTLQNVKQITNGIEGDITLNSSKYLVFSIPYSSGWSAYVDGKKVDLDIANITYMGMMISKGNHHVVLKYETPGLKTGIIISIVSLLILIFVTIIHRRKKSND